MFFIFRAKLISTTLALRTTSYLSMETEYMPWQSALDSLQYYFLMLDRTDVFHPMQVLLMSEFLEPFPQSLWYHIFIIVTCQTSAPSLML